LDAISLLGVQQVIDYVKRWRLHEMLVQ
jgi:hypothetical protein